MEMFRLWPKQFNHDYFNCLMVATVLAPSSVVIQPQFDPSVHSFADIMRGQWHLRCLVAVGPHVCCRGQIFHFIQHCWNVCSDAVVQLRDCSLWEEFPTWQLLFLGKRLQHGLKRTLLYYINRNRVFFCSAGDLILVWRFTWQQHNDPKHTWVV